MDGIQLDLVLSVLAQSSRRRMLDLLTGTPGMNVKALASHFDVSRIAVLKHLRLLEETGLVVSRKAGRMWYLFFNPMPIQQIYDRWTTQYAGFWAGRMINIKTRVEAVQRRKEAKHRVLCHIHRVVRRRSPQFLLSPASLLLRLGSYGPCTELHSYERSI